MEGNVLPTIAQSIIAAVAPSVVGSNCATRRLRRNIRRPRNRVLDAVGIRSIPDAQILDGVECSNEHMTNDDTECVVVKSAFSVYVTGDEDVERAAIEEVLKTQLNSDDFSIGLEHVDRITFIEIEIATPSNRIDPVQSPQQVSTDPHRVILSIIVLLILAVPIALVVVLCVRRFKQRSRARLESSTDDEKALMAGCQQ